MARSVSGGKVRKLSPVIVIPPLTSLTLQQTANLRGADAQAQGGELGAPFGSSAVPRSPRHSKLEPRLARLDGMGAVLDPGPTFFASALHFAAAIAGE
jgi:hypothetical protein